VGDPPGQGPLVLVEGAVEDNHGVPVVVDARVRRPLPGDGEQNGRVVSTACGWCGRRRVLPQR
jgi:hypothetical protein